VRHSGRGRAAGKFAETAGLEGPAIRRTARGDAGPPEARRFRPIPDAGARSGQTGTRPEPGAGPSSESVGAGTGTGTGTHARSGILLPDRSGADGGTFAGGAAQRRVRAD